MSSWIVRGGGLVLVAVTAACTSIGDGAGDQDDAGPGEGPGGGGLDAGGVVTCLPVELARSCRPDWYSDAECDPANNFAECQWDGGDCCSSTCDQEGCGDYGFDCRDPAAGGGGLQEPEPIGDPCGEVVDPLAPDRLRSEVELLSSNQLAGRRPGSTSDLTTRRYLEARFRCLGLAPAIDGCYQQGFLTADGDPTANVVGVIPGSDPRLAGDLIVVGAHHDHIGVESGTVHNGANDNASGTVALLAIADRIQRAPVAPRRTVVFAAFAAEESDLQGSIHYSANPPAGQPIEDVVYMINLDMLGTYQVAGRVDAFGTFAGTPGRALLEPILESHGQLEATLGVASPDDDSDYDPFCEIGIPYVYFETFDPPCWHEPCDDAARMDYAHMSELTLVLHDVLIALANTEMDLAGFRDQAGCGQ